MKRFPTLVILGALVLLPTAVLWTCHRYAKDSGPAAFPSVVSEGGYPLRLALPSGEDLVLEHAPLRIVPANAGALDFVSLLVPPERVAGLPSGSFDYTRLADAPPEVHAAWSLRPTFSGYLAERILALEPDLVIAHGWQSLETTALLRSEGVDVLVLPLPERWEEVRVTLALLGRVLGREEQADRLLSELAARVAALEQLEHAPNVERALSYSNLGAAGWAAGAGTTADILFQLAGLRNAATEAGLSGHESLSIEALLSLDPDVIVVGTVPAGDGPGPTETYLRGEARLGSLRAVREERIVALPPRLFTTSSSELVRGAELLVEALDALDSDGG